jgi:AcrR family transcriptional regulator
VVEEAARVGDAAGFDRLSLAAVAKRLNVAVPSLYKHVDGLDGLRRAVAVAAAGQLAEALGRAAMGRSGPDAVRALADAYRAFARAHPGRYAALQTSPAPGDTEAAAAFYAPVEVFQAVLRGFGVAEDARIDVIRAVRSALHGFVDLETRGGFGLADDVDRSFGVLVEGLVDLVAGRAAGSAPG